MRAKLEWFVARGAFPLAVIAAIGGAILWMDAGVSPDAVAAQVILLSYLFIALLERLFPLHPEWSRSHGDLGADVGLGVTNAIVLAAAQRNPFGYFFISTCQSPRLDLSLFRPLNQPSSSTNLSAPISAA